jgi:hypothetical protein
MVPERGVPKLSAMARELAERSLATKPEAA